MKKWILVLCVLLSGCKSEREILCTDPQVSQGNMRIVNRQCVSFGERVIGLIEFEDVVTKKHYTYTMNAIDGKVVFNLTTPQMMAISAADDAQASSTMAVGMAAASMASAGSK